GKGVHGADDLLALAREVAPGAKVTLVVARGEERREVAFRARDPEGYVAYFHFPGVVIYEHDARKDATTFGVILNIFKYTRVESRRTYRFFWVVSLTTGTNEELREVAE
ncbi:MAG: hypothetical protein HY721_33555, partial [Planctomycetes bacterium]|nr:hypothetical protein [Planctomycetota bacterium]